MHSATGSNNTEAWQHLRSCIKSGKPLIVVVSEEGFRDNWFILCAFLCLNFGKNEHCFFFFKKNYIPNIGKAITRKRQKVQMAQKCMQ